MSADAMDMHQTWQEFIAFHSIRDSDEVYSNGIEFVPVWRVEQMMAHYHDPLKAENAKLRELVRLMVERDDMLLCGHGCTPSTCKAYDSDVCERIGHLSNELGIEMDDDA